MATVTGTVNNKGLVNMVNGLTSLTLVLRAIDSDGSTVLDTSGNLTFLPATTVATLNFNASTVELTITGTNITVGSVQLWDSVNSELIATATLTTDNVFPAGGILIVTSFEISVV